MHLGFNQREKGIVQMQKENDSIPLGLVHYVMLLGERTRAVLQAQGQLIQHVGGRNRGNR